MGKRPFELLGRQLVEGGIVLVFRCAACGNEARLKILDDDPLSGRYPVACPCGAEVSMYFGSPAIGRALLRSLRNAPARPDEYHRCSVPMMN